MNYVYPELWAPLTMPNKRHELIGVIEEIAGASSLRAYQNQQGMEKLDIDYVVHFLFDDSDIGINALDYLGDVFLNQEEAILVSSFCRKLDDLLSLLGDEPTEVFVAHPEWKEISTLAFIALNSLVRNGIPIGIED
jgi:hypothetical protein